MCYDGSRIYESDGILTFTVDGRKEKEAPRLKHYPYRGFEEALSESEIRTVIPND